MLRQRGAVASASLAVLLSIAAWNYFAVVQPSRRAIAADRRNDGIRVRTHFRNYLNPNTLVFDLRHVPLESSSADVFRLLLQVAASLKERQFERIELAYRGETRFVLRGQYFRQLGHEYGVQNPIYTMRTFPQNLYAPDGVSAYPAWTGGWLGVTAKQMEDFSDFHSKWYLSDLLAHAIKHVAANPPKANHSSAATTQELSSSASAVDERETVQDEALIGKSGPSLPAPASETVATSHTQTKLDDSAPRALTFEDQVQAARSAKKYYLDEEERSFHEPNCPRVRPAEMTLVIKPVVVLKKYSAHACVRMEDDRKQ